MPKPRNHALFVRDMREAADRIATYVEGYDFASFRADQRTVDAVLRNFEILGEASARVPPDMQALGPDIDWRGIKDFRNVIVHFYAGIDLELVWDLIDKRLPQLRADLANLAGRVDS